MDRRGFLRAGVGVGALAATYGSPFWSQALRAAALPTAGDGPYGPLGPPDANGIRLPTGFTSRVIAISGELVSGFGGYPPYEWHSRPDGGATYFTPDNNGWLYVSNSETSSGAGGGASAVRFASNGVVLGAYRILGGTSINCAGGKTPWQTWLSCEEYGSGRVWECDPLRPSQGVARPALGLFSHEAVCVDKRQRRLYLTEDKSDGRLYRFTPSRWPDLSLGVLKAAAVGPAPDFKVSWVAVDATQPQSSSNRPPGTTGFNRGEGCWFKSGTVYFTTTGSNQVWAYDTATQRLRVIYDDDDFIAAGMTPPLTGVDNITVVKSGDVYVAEDGGDMQLILITPDAVVAPVLQVTGQNGSEITGPAFDPWGKRLYFSSQVGGPNGIGITYEVRGPFR
jgi:hypothetical protein